MLDFHPQYRVVSYAVIVVVTLLIYATRCSDKNNVGRIESNRRQEQAHQQQQQQYENAFLRTRRQLLDDAAASSSQELKQVLHHDVFDRQGQLHSPPAAAVQPRIVGGTPAPAGAFPFYAKSLPETLCGATLIWEDILLTAAHCEGAFLNGVAIGGTRLDDSDATVLPVDSELPHPNYDVLTNGNGTYFFFLGPGPFVRKLFCSSCSRTDFPHSIRHYACKVNRPK
jgi:hypothetical protein